MLTLNYFYIVLIIEVFFILAFAAYYFFKCFRKSQSALQDLQQRPPAPPPIISNDAISEAEEALKNKQFIINMLLEKLDCYDDSNLDLKSFKEQFTALKKNYQNIRENTSVEPEEAEKNSQQMSAFEDKIDELEEELNKIVSNATTIVGELNRDNIADK